MKHLDCVPAVSMISFIVYSTLAIPWTNPPMDPGHPFLFIWNAPFERCQSKFGLPLDLSHFHLISAPLKNGSDQPVTLFYSDRFGIFPYIAEDTGKIYNLGLPQLVDLDEHVRQAEKSIELYIPVDNQGLAVLDFEEWRPQWNRNWAGKDIYRRVSVDTLKKKNASLTDSEAKKQAKIVYESAAKSYFLRSLNIGKKLRPKRLWGLYLFPDCYNYKYFDNFTGDCPDVEKVRNDELLWLWNATTALIPSIYLDEVLKDSMMGRLFVRHRMKETIRVSALLNRSSSLPMYAYVRPVYKDNEDRYVSEMDLVNMIGEAAALGSAGVVSWGGTKITDTEASCSEAQRYLEQVMNVYILNVSTATQLCSQALCQGQGRCTRKRWNSGAFLHLDPRRYRIERQRNRGPLVVRGRLSQDDVDYFDAWFECACYSEQLCRSPLTILPIQESSANKAGACVLLMGALLWNLYLSLYVLL